MALTLTRLEILERHVAALIQRRQDAIDLPYDCVVEQVEHDLSDALGSLVYQRQIARRKREQHALAEQLERKQHDADDRADQATMAAGTYPE